MNVKINDTVWVHKTMKILITTDLFTTNTNGVVTSIKNLEEELIKRGHTVKILTISDHVRSYKRKNEYYIKSVPFKIYPDVRMPLSYRHRFIKEIIEWKPDVIHSQCEFFSLQFAIYISKKTMAPIVHTYHTLYEQYVHYIVPGKHLGKYVVESVTRKRLKEASVVIAPTAKVKKALIDYGVETPIRIVPSGIDLKQHKVLISPSERKQMRNDLGISDEDKVLINLGRLGDEKNLDELVIFFKDVVCLNENARFLLVGDGPARKRLKHMAKELKIADKVIFTGMVKPEDVQKYYQLGDVFVSASTSETQGLTYVEAAANGLPLICRADLCLKGIIYEGKNGYEYTCKKDFVQKVLEVFADDEWRNRASKKSRDVANKYDKSVFGDSIEKIYQELM